MIREISQVVGSTQSFVWVSLESWNPEMNRTLRWCTQSPRFASISADGVFLSSAVDYDSTTFRVHRCRVPTKKRKGNSNMIPLPCYWSDLVPPAKKNEIDYYDDKDEYDEMKIISALKSIKLLSLLHSNFNGNFMWNFFYNSNWTFTLDTRTWECYMRGNNTSSVKIEHLGGWNAGTG